MKVVFMVYHDILEDRIEKVQKELGIDFYTKWENVLGKGHNTEGHLGSRTFPGHNSVKMIAFENDEQVEKFIDAISKVNEAVTKKDDKIRIFQMPLERIL